MTTNNSDDPTLGATDKFKKDIDEINSTFADLEKKVTVVNDLAGAIGTVGENLTVANTGFTELNKNLEKLEAFHNAMKLPDLASQVQITSQSSAPAASAKTDPDDRNAIKKLLKDFEELQRDRDEMKQQYEQQISFLKDQNTKPGGSHEGKLDETIKAAEKQQTAVLEEYDEKIKELTDQISELFDTLTAESAKSMRESAETLESFIQKLKDGLTDEAAKLIPEVTAEQLENLQQSEESLQRLQEEVENLQEAAAGSQTAFGQMAEGLKEALNAGSDIGKLEGGLDKISKGFANVAEMVSMFTASLKNIGEMAGSNTLGSIANGLDDVINVAGSALQGAKGGAAFGPIGAIVGAIAGIATTTTKMLAENKKNRDMLKQQMADKGEQEYFAEKEINRQYRERYDWSKKIGETSLEYIARQGTALKQMREANAAEQEDYMAKLQNMEFKSSEQFQSTGVFGWGKGKIKEEWSSLSGKSFEEIEKLVASGKLSKEGEQYFEALKKARQEGDQLADRQEDYVQQAAEMLTGTTHDALLNSIVGAFKEGKRSIQDFADTFDEIMRGAMMKSFAADMSEPVKQWHDKFASLLEKDKGKLTKDSINELNKQFKSTIVDPRTQKIKEFEEATGISLSPNKNASSQVDAQREFDNYLKASIEKLEKDRLALTEDGRFKRLEQSRLEYEANLTLINQEFEERKKVLKLFNKEVQDEKRKELEGLKAAQIDYLKWEKDYKEAQINAEYDKQASEIEKRLTAYKYTNESLRQTGIRDATDSEIAKLIGMQETGSLSQEKVLELIGQAENSQQYKLLQPLLEKFKPDDSKREDIEKYYEEILKLLEDSNTQKGGLYEGKLDAVIANVNKQKVTDLAKHDSNAKGYSDVISKLFEKEADMSVKSMRKMEDELNTFWKLLDDNKLDEAAKIFPDLKLTPEELQNLANNSESMKQFKESIDGLGPKADEAEKGFNKMGVALKKMFSAGSNQKDMGKALTELSEGFEDVSFFGNQFAESLGGIAELTGSGALSSMAEGISSAINIAGSALQSATEGFQRGGTVGAIAAAGLSLVSSITGIFSANKKHREMLKQQLRDNAEKSYYAELDINQLYRQRYEWARKIGESSINHIARQGKELKDQSAANSKEQEELLSKLMGTDYKTNEYFKKTGLFGWGKGKIVTEWSSLSGKSWEEIERLAASGKLSEEGTKYYEALKKAREEGENLAQRQEEYLEMVRETFTGSSYESLVDNIVEGFKQGKRSAEDFADTFEDLMRGSVTSALKLFLDDSLRQWYEKWGELSKDGLTEAEIAMLQKEYDELIAEADRKRQELENFTGISLTGEENTSPEPSRKGFAAMSQEVGDELNGRFTALQESGYRLEQFAINRNEALNNIGFDTSSMRTNVGLIGMSVDEIRDINRQSMNHLYKIEKNTALLNSTNELLGKVVSNTANL